jgi:adenylosuccinate synthase
MSRKVPIVPAGRDVLVLGLQYGDEGKGRVVDNLAAEEDSVVIRYAGGPNAGHTVVTDGTVHRFHGLPSGFAAGRDGIIGGGCVVDLDSLADEMARLQASSPGGALRISSRAHAIMPYHIVQDAAEELWRNGATARLGTTGRGIGPAYADKAARTGLRLGDLLLGRRGEELARRYVAFKRRLVALCLDQPELLDEPGLDAGHVIDGIRRWRHEFAGMLIDDEAYLAELRTRGDVRLIFEGAQAFGLDLEYGRYPFVSSSVNSVAGAIAAGARSPYVIGVTKCYTIAVGEGPMPTEVNGDLADAIRRRGLEFGTTTGRARRIGWLDLPLLRRAVRVNGVDGICLTNLDVVAGFDRLAMATEYVSSGSATNVVPFLLDAWQDAVATLEEHAAWPPLDGIGDWHDLPDAVRSYIAALEQAAETPVQMVTFGRERDAALSRSPVPALA